MHQNAPEKLAPKRSNMHFHDPNLDSQVFEHLHLAMVRHAFFSCLSICWLTMLSCWKWTTSAIRDGSTNPIAKTERTLHLGRGEHLRPWRNKRRVEGWMDLPSLIWRNREVVGGSRGVDFDKSVLRWKSCVRKPHWSIFFL